MKSIFKTQRHIEFADTDLAGIVHFSMFFKYMEEAEHQFWRSIDLSVSMKDEKGHLGFPRVSAKCDYKQPLRFEDLVDIEIFLAKKSEKTITFEFHFQLNGDDVAVGQLIVVCCRFPADGSKPFAVTIPDNILNKLPQI